MCLRIDFNILLIVSKEKEMIPHYYGMEADLSKTEIAKTGLIKPKLVYTKSPSGKKLTWGRTQSVEEKTHQRKSQVVKGKLDFFHGLQADVSRRYLARV